MIKLVENIKKEVIEFMNISYRKENEVKDFISKKSYEYGRNAELTVTECINYSEIIYNDMFKLGKIQKFLDDIEISEIMINGLSPIIIEKAGIIITTEEKFSTVSELENLIQIIVSKVNKRVNATTPIVDVRLEDGSRVNIVLGPVAINGPIVTIRKFNNKKFNLDYLVSTNTLTKEASCLLKELVRAKYNIFISGGTSSGKTTFLNALSENIPSNERVITIEDSAELSLKGIFNLVSLEIKPANLEGEGAIVMEDLIKTALRMRPDRIIVGEVRGKETLEMLNAMNTGHDGSLSTGHGNSSIDMLKRLELMVLRAVDIPILVIKHLIASSIDILIHLERNIYGKRRVMEISEIVKTVDGYDLNLLFVYEKEKLIKKNIIMNNTKIKKYELDKI